MNILVIDDDERVRILLKDILQIGGHHVIETSDGELGIHYLEKDGLVDMVLTDLGMPKMNGWDVARWIKMRNPELPVILITGWGEDLDEEKVKEGNVDLIIPKPFEVYEILKAVECLGRSIVKKLA